MDALPAKPSFQSLLPLLAAAMIGGSVTPIAVYAASPVTTAYFVVNSYTTGDQDAPAVAKRADGSFLVVWARDSVENEGHAIVARSFDAFGIPDGEEFQLNTPTSEILRTPDLVHRPGGGFVVTWVNGDYLTGVDGDGQGIVALLLDGDGVPAGTEFVVNSYTTSVQKHAEVAVGSSGDFVVVWESWPPQDGDGRGIFGQLFDASGSAIGTEFQVNTFTTGVQRDPEVAFDDDGFLVVWHDEDSQDGNGFGAFGRHYDSSATPTADQFQINEFTTGWQWRADVETLPGIGFVVVWQQNANLAVPDDEIRARIFDSTGLPLAAPVVVSTTTGSFTRPSVSGNSDGSFGVLWGGGSNAEGRVRFFDSTGSALSPETRVGPLAGIVQSGIAVAGDRYVGTWRTQSGDASGTAIGAVVGCFSAGPDSDGDGIADVCDPCTGPSTVIDVKPRLRFKFIGREPIADNDRLAFSGEHALPAGLSFGDLDPSTVPLLVRVDNEATGPMIAESLATGAFAGKGTAGWRRNGKGTKWKYVDKTEAPPAGIVGLRLDDRSKKAPGRVRVKIKGKNGSYPIDGTPADLTLSYGDAGAGECVSTMFSDDDCGFSGVFTRFGCKQK